MKLPPGTGRLYNKMSVQVSLAATCFLVAAYFAVAACLAQAVQPTLQQFAGTWQARFDGKVFQTIKLEMHEGQLTGTASGIHIEQSSSGKLTRAESTGVSDPIAEAKLTDKTLLLTIKVKDSEDTVQFEMTLTGTDQAQIRLVAPGEGGSPKPWKSERTRAGQ